MVRKLVSIKYLAALLIGAVLYAPLCETAFADDATTPLHQIRKHPVDPRAAINPGEGVQENGAVDGCDFRAQGVCNLHAMRSDAATSAIDQHLLSRLDFRAAHERQRI